MTKTTYSRKGLFVAYDSRGIAVPHQHGRERWQQAGMAARMAPSLVTNRKQKR